MQDAIDYLEKEAARARENVRALESAIEYLKKMNKQDPALHPMCAPISSFLGSAPIFSERHTPECCPNEEMRETTSHKTSAI